MNNTEYAKEAEELVSELDELNKKLHKAEISIEYASFLATVNNAKINALMCKMIEGIGEAVGGLVNESNI